MTQPFQRLRQFLAELKRRKVYRVAAVYAAVAFVIVQAANLVFPALDIPSWAYSLVVVFALLGFPIAVVLAWAFEVTPEGVRRTPESEEPAEEGPPEADRGLGTGYKVLVGLGLVAAAVAGGWYLTGGGESTAGARLGERSVAVLPFESLGREEPGTFTAGMHDALLARLSNVEGLRVISRTAVEPYRDTDRTTGEIARELGVRWVLEGGVQEMGDQIQVNAQLIDPRSETHAWAQTYRRDLTAEDLFALQSDITKRIARSLEAQLTPAEQERVERRPTESLDAYRLYVRGRTLLDRRTEAGMRQGLRYFRSAIAQDSSYALAWSGLADVRILLASYGYGAADSLLRQAQDAARRALELQPNLAEARASLGLIHMTLHQDGPTALGELQRATALKPSYARAYHWLALIELTLGRRENALSSVERAAELDPHSAPIQVARSFVLYLDRQAGRALEAARRARELSPGFPLAEIAEGVALAGTRQWESALEPLRRGLDAARPGSQTYQAILGVPVLVSLRAGDTAAARAYLAELERQDANRYARGFAHAALGQPDAAFAHLREAPWNHAMTQQLRYDAVFESLRDDPRYDELLRDVNRTWGLNPDGSLPDSANVSFGSRADD